MTKKFDVNVSLLFIHVDEKVILRSKSE